MSLRQKGIEILFTDFIKKNFSYFGFQESTNLTPEVLIRALQQSQLYEKTITTIEVLWQSWAGNPNPEEEIHIVCDAIRKNFHFSKFFLVSVNPKQKKVEMVFSYPKRTDKEMSVNLPFVEMSADKHHQIKCAEAIKNYFQIDFPNMNFEVLNLESHQGNHQADNPKVQFLFYLPGNRFTGDGPTNGSIAYKASRENQVPLAYSHLLKFIFNFSKNVLSLLSVNTEKSGRKISLQPKFIESIKKISPSQQSSQRNASGMSQLSAKKANVYQRIVSQLPALIGDKREEVEQAAKFLLQVAHFSEAVVCNKNLTEVYGIYSLNQPKHNQIRGKMPEDLRKKFSEAEKKHLARKVNSAHGKCLLIFLSHAVHPQKKLPDFPFSSYPDILIKTLIKLSNWLKKK